jgi:hypothetical protein
MPIAAEIACVNMRRKVGAVQEIHKETERGFVLRGRMRVTAVDDQGLAFTPYELVRARLKIDRSVPAKIPTRNTPVVPG